MSEQTQPLSPEIPANPEADPLFLTEAESEQIHKLTDQFSRPQALKMVLTADRHRRYIAAEVRQKMDRSSNAAKEMRQSRDDETAAQRSEDTLRLLRETDPQKIKPSAESGDQAA
jgi:hypothetical protein